MALYPETIARCQHIKINGTQCASPSLRRGKFCYFHQEWRPTRLVIGSGSPAAGISTEPSQVTLPVLEDANSIQMGVLEVMRMLVTRRIDPRTGGLLLYALQTASANLGRTTFEPELATQVVIDEECVEHRPIGATAWSIAKDKEYDAVKPDVPEQPSGLAKILIESMGLYQDPEDQRRFGTAEKEEEEEEERV